jgi:hypothetical protein
MASFKVHDLILAGSIHVQCLYFVTLSSMLTALSGLSLESRRRFKVVLEKIPPPPQIPFATYWIPPDTFMRIAFIYIKAKAPWLEKAKAKLSLCLIGD